MNVKELQSILKGELLTEESSKRIQGFSIDTRTMQKGEVFVALVSTKQDGHRYIKEAIRKKASCIIVSKKIDIKTHIPIILVKSTYDALFRIGNYYREKYPILYIGITGSNGKTTTKELLYTVLSTKYKVLKTEKNYNNHIGIPLTLTHLTRDHEIALMEMGMNHRGEIEKLSHLVKPNLAIITNIGTSHIGNLGSRKNICKAKLEITKGITDGVLLISGDDTYLRNVKSASNFEVVHCGYHSSYGLKPYHVKATTEHLSFSLKYQNKKYEVIVPVYGKHFLIDIMITIETCLLLGIPLEEIICSLKNFKPSSQRMNIYHKENYTIIDDCYNASYDSFKGLISFLKDIKEDKILIIGDMLELGKYSRLYHRKLGKLLKKIKKCKILLVGKETKLIKGKNMIHFEANKEIISYLQKQNISHHVIVFKGSRGMHLEEVIKSL